MGKEEESTPLKVYADGNGGIYLDPEEVLNDPEIRRKAKEFSTYLRDQSRKKDSNTDSDTEPATK